MPIANCLWSIGLAPKVRFCNWDSAIGDESKLDPLLCPDAGVEWMFDLAHLRDEIGGLDQFGWSVATGEDNM